jgi:hypothetical protein
MEEATKIATAKMMISISTVSPRFVQDYGIPSFLNENDGILVRDPFTINYENQSRNPPYEHLFV